MRRRGPLPDGMQQWGVPVVGFSGESQVDRATQFAFSVSCKDGGTSAPRTPPSAMEGGRTERKLGVDPPMATFPDPPAGGGMGAAREARLAFEQNGCRDQEPPHKPLRTGPVGVPSPWWSWRNREDPGRPVRGGVEPYPRAPQASLSPAT